ncbi:MAG TPA: class I lanthipeptide [Kofleriaceae bacterium]
MKKPTLSRKLSLQRESLRHLDVVKLQHVVGGAAAALTLPGNPCNTHGTFDGDTRG